MGSPGGPVPSTGPGHDADIARERDRIAAELRNEVIQRAFATGLNLQNIAAITADPLVRRRVEQAVTDLDRLIQIVRDTVFGLEHRLTDRGLRAGIVHLCEQFSPVPDVSFRGPVDGALHPAATIGLLEVVADALAALRPCWAPALIDVTAADGAHVTVLQAVPLPDATRTGEADHVLGGLRARAAQAGIRIEIEPGPGLVQICWHAA